MNENKYLTPEQLSQRWGGSPTVETLRNWRSQGRGVKFIKIGKLIKYPLSEILKFEKSRKILNRSRI